MCDTFTERLSAGKDKVQTLWHNAPKTYEDRSNSLYQLAFGISTPSIL